MNEEIKKLIELRINAGVIENRSNYALFNEGMRKGSEIAKEIILSKWQEAERWRNVEEELPDIDDYLQHSVVAYLVKLDSGAYALAVYHDDGIWLESGTEHDLNVTEWKPIS
ncbi:hypothetical protein [Dysgonomonas sp. 37-18]|uniref:hypothetical protein n=1 Tax=Dysgonomonas sp. 37-18 TaxID=1895907 RepID=UPI0009260B11|nr:hypothetical protein [Dysgonomonas sp. 37-18]OJX63080.1 MAG: hypothetical protein BGO84_14345 [Dysgonomonas sp. 37-18]